MTPITWFRTLALFTILATTAVLSSHPDAFARDETKGKKYALLVGVTEYDSKNFSTLNYSDNDAERMAVALKKAGFVSVRVLSSTRGNKDAQDAPTTANIQTELKTLLAKKTKHDTVLVGLAGHGMQLEVTPDKGEGQAKQYSYFCPKDASLQGISYTTGKSDQLILLDDLFKQLGDSDAGHRLALIDACRNDARAKAGKRARLDVGRVTIPDGVGALFSCSRGQFAFETDALNHGVFFHHVIKGIEGEAINRKGAVTWASLIDYVQSEVPASVEKHFGKEGGKQVPASMGNLEGESVLARYGSSASNLKTNGEGTTPLEGKGKDKVKDGGKKNDKQPKTLTVEDKDSGFKMELVLIPATGKDGFTMGSTEKEQDTAIADVERLTGIRVQGAGLAMFRAEGPQHKVVLTKPFYMGKFEVTQKQYKTLMNTNPSYHSATGLGAVLVATLTTDDFPVETVSWDDAQEFVKAMAKLPAMKDKKLTCRLPTEAEWEYACRGGTDVKEAFDLNGKPSNSIGAGQANFNAYHPYGGGELGIPWLRTCKVGTYKANKFGLYDMHGNVMEWCEDALDMKAYKADRTDPSVTGNAVLYRVTRGGGFSASGVHCRASGRFGLMPALRVTGTGFRVVVQE